MGRSVIITSAPSSPAAKPTNPVPLPSSEKDSWLVHILSGLICMKFFLKELLYCYPWLPNIYFDSIHSWCLSQDKRAFAAGKMIDPKSPTCTELANLIPSISVTSSSFTIAITTLMRLTHKSSTPVCCRLPIRISIVSCVCWHFANKSLFCCSPKKTKPICI